MLLADDLNQLLDVLPTFISDPLKKHSSQDHLVEIVLDIGRRPEARFANGTDYLSYRTVVWQDLDYILKQIAKNTKKALEFLTLMLLVVAVGLNWHCDQG